MATIVYEVTHEDIDNNFVGSRTFIDWHEAKAYKRKMENEFNGFVSFNKYYDRTNVRSADKIFNYDHFDKDYIYS